MLANLGLRWQHHSGPCPLALKPLCIWTLHGVTIVIGSQVPRLHLSHAGVPTGTLKNSETQTSLHVNLSSSSSSSSWSSSVSCMVVIIIAEKLDLTPRPRARAHRVRERGRVMWLGPDLMHQQSTGPMKQTTCIGCFFINCNISKNDQVSVIVMQNSFARTDE